LLPVFGSEVADPDPALVDKLAAAYFSSGFNMKAVMRELFLSPQFTDSTSHFARYAWPGGFVARAIKEVGWGGYTVSDAVTALANMGQILFEPPDVAGWDPGRSWFSAATMVARMNTGPT